MCSVFSSLLFSLSAYSRGRSARVGFNAEPSLQHCLNTVTLNKAIPQTHHLRIAPTLQDTLPKASHLDHKDHFTKTKLNKENLSRTQPKCTMMAAYVYS